MLLLLCRSYVLFLLFWRPTVFTLLVSLLPYTVLFRSRWYGRHGWHGLVSPRCSLPTEKAGAKAPAFFAGPAYRAIPTSDCYGHARVKGFTRSEEHTSELQSLMRNSYAVFCLKKTMT